MTSRRFDPYTLVHKGQRKKLFELTTAAGRLAAEDRESRASLVAEVQATLSSLSDHAEAEDEHLGPLYRAVAPETAARLAREHGSLAASLAALRVAADVALAEASPVGDLALYRALGRFTGEYLGHLDQEEASMPELWAKLDDAAIARAQGALVASHPPATVQFNLRNMLPAGSPAERIGFLSSLRRNMPAPAFEGVRGLVGPLVSSGEWAAIERA